MTELMKRYEAETGNEVQSNAFAQHEIWEYIRWLESQLTEQTLEKFQEIIRNQCDEISALKDQLTWRPVSEKPKENMNVEVCDMSKSSLDEREPVIAYYEKGKWVCVFPYNYDVYAYITPTHWRYIPPAPEVI
jgi:hypothetical protein